MKYALYNSNGTSEIIESALPIGLAKLQELVVGDIEAYTTTQGVHVYINEEGRLNDLPSNPFFPEDLRGNVVVTGGTDDEGNDKGLPEDYVLRTLASLPTQLFEDGRKFTIIWISDNWGATVVGEIKTCGRSSSIQENPLFKVRGKRTPSRWRAKNSEIMIFEGWDLPFKEGSLMPRKSGGTTIRMNAMYNLGGMPKEELAKFIEDKQINPYFMLKDHINFIHEDGETEELLFPYSPPTNQRIADMQGAQLKDGKFRIVATM